MVSSVFISLGVIICVALLAIGFFYLMIKIFPPSQEVPVEKEPEVLPVKEENQYGTVYDLFALSKLGYGDCSYNAPVQPPYSFFFFIVKYKTTKNTYRYAIAVSRGFEAPRIIKGFHYDELSDITRERIEKASSKFDMFVDDKQFNEFVTKYRGDCIATVIKKL